MALDNFFYMIVELVQPNSGNIYLDLNITDYPMYKAQQGIGYLAQEASVEN
jgi:lipopolysaccharide export system ATP-binding protein